MDLCRVMAQGGWWRWGICGRYSDRDSADEARLGIYIPRGLFYANAINEASAKCFLRTSIYYTGLEIVDQNPSATFGPAMMNGSICVPHALPPTAVSLLSPLRPSHYRAHLTSTPFSPSNLLTQHTLTLSRQPPVDGRTCAHTE